MKKIFLALCFLLTFSFASVKHIEPRVEYVENSGIRVLDIRTQPEWIQTGIVKDSATITFFDARGGYDARGFLQQLQANGFSKDEEFALICRTGNRTTAVSDFLSKMGYKVINFKGGIVSLISKGYKPQKYKADK